MLDKCKYGCGQDALFTLKNGSPCCSKSSNSCPIIRKKNSSGVKTSGKDWKKVYRDLTPEKKQAINWNKDRRSADFVYGGRGQHKSALLLERGQRCENCLLEEWMGVPITLELEHSDGDRKNNTRENLKLLCPNCHSLTPTWRRSSQGGWKRKKYTDQEMIDAIVTSENLHQALQKLDLRYGSASTLVGVMGRYKVDFMGR